MGGIGSKQHEELLLKTRNDFIERGWRVIRLEGKSPDAIAAKMDNGKLKIIAICVLIGSYSRKLF